MNRWTRVLLAALFLFVSLAAISACSLRYDFTECSADSDCSRLETTGQADPLNNELYECQDQECVVIPDWDCRTIDDCDTGQTCESNKCVEDVIDNDAGDTDDAGDTGDTGDTGDAGDTEEVIDNTCETDADCVTPGEACAANSECAPVDCSSDGDSYCTDTFGSDYACGTGDECASTACNGAIEGTDLEETEYCRDAFGESFYCGPSETCMDTARAGCEDLFYPSDVPKKKVMILGSIVPTGPGFEGLGTTIVNGVRMALIEFTENAGQLLDNTTVAHLQCSPGSDGTAVELADHMRALGVTSIVGPLTSGNYLDVVRNSTGDSTDAPAVTIAPGATSPSIENLSAAGTYSFQLIANDTFQSTAIVDRLSDLRDRSCTEVTDTECTIDTECAAQFGPDWEFNDQNASEPCHDPNPNIVVFYKDDKYGRDLQTFVQSRFGDRYDQASVKYYEYENPLGMSESEIQTSYANLATTAISEETDVPDQVVFIGTGEAVSFAGIYISALSNASKDPTTRTYVFSHGAAADTPTLFSDVGLSDVFLERVEAIAPNIFNTTNGLYEPWQLRYSAIFNEPAQTSVGGIAYDSALMHIFAMDAASVSGPITADSVSQVLQDGVLQDASGTQILFKDPNFPGEAQQQLGRGNNIDLVGVSGQLNFVYENDVNLGIVRSNYIGLDVRSRDTPTGTVYEGTPARLYILQSGEIFGTWAPIP
ncbi:MAG: hypothetical protein ACQEVA_09820 [Myxococcota bacterium]